MIAKRSALVVLLLFLPATAFAAKRYVVKRGDNLHNLAKKFRVSLLSIKKVNNLSSDRLMVGNTILIPSPSERTSVNQIAGSSKGVQQGAEEKEPVETKVNLSPALSKYVVKKGDTLSGIANQLGVSVKDLKSANGLRSNNVRIGLSIPSALSANVNAQVAQKRTVSLNVNETTRYVVKRNDNLILIAKRFNVSVESLRKVNHIKGNAIQIGQAISVPIHRDAVKLNVEDINISQDKNDVKTKTGTGDHDYHQKNGDDDVVSRDSIIKIAKRFLGVPYKFGGTSLIKGLDCSAFVGKVFSFLNVDLPRTARELFRVGRGVDRNHLTAGDLVFFRTYASYPSHVGIYMGDSEFIHASSKARMVTIDSIDCPYFTKRYIGARRIENAGLFYEELSHDYRGFERQ